MVSTYVFFEYSRYRFTIFSFLRPTSCVYNIQTMGGCETRANVFFSPSFDAQHTHRAHQYFSKRKIPTLCAVIICDTRIYLVHRINTVVTLVKESGHAMAETTPSTTRREPAIIVPTKLREWNKMHYCYYAHYKKKRSKEYKGIIKLRCNRERLSRKKKMSEKTQSVTEPS